MDILILRRKKICNALIILLLCCLSTRHAVRRNITSSIAVAFSLPLRISAPTAGVFNLFSTEADPRNCLAAFQFVLGKGLLAQYKVPGFSHGRKAFFFKEIWMSQLLCPHYFHTQYNYSSICYVLGRKTSMFRWIFPNTNPNFCRVYFWVNRNIVSSFLREYSFKL
jgi:hypothetical protein